MAKLPVATQRPLLHATGCWTHARRPLKLLLGCQGPLEPVYRAALALGTANQLTNILRDVGEDAAERNRIYVPVDELDEFGISEAEVCMAPALCERSFQHGSEGHTGVWAITLSASCGLTCSTAVPFSLQFPDSQAQQSMSHSQLCATKGN